MSTRKENLVRYNDLIETMKLENLICQVAQDLYSVEARPATNATNATNLGEITLTKIYLSATMRKWMKHTLSQWTA